MVPQHPSSHHLLSLVIWFWRAKLQSLPNPSVSPSPRKCLSGGTTQRRPGGAQSSASHNLVRPPFALTLSFIFWSMVGDVSSVFLGEHCPPLGDDRVAEPPFLCENTASHLSVLGSPNLQKLLPQSKCSHLPTCPLNMLFLERVFGCGQPGTQCSVAVEAFDVNSSDHEGKQPPCLPATQQ